MVYGWIWCYHGLPMQCNEAAMMSPERDSLLLVVGPGMQKRHAMGNDRVWRAAERRSHGAGRKQTTCEGFALLMLQAEWQHCRDVLSVQEMRGKNRRVLTVPRRAGQGASFVGGLFKGDCTESQRALSVGRRSLKGVGGLGLFIERPW